MGNCPGPKPEHCGKNEEGEDEKRAGPPPSVPFLKRIAPGSVGSGLWSRFLHGMVTKDDMDLLVGLWNVPCLSSGTSQE